ncbi:hypothetical protein SSPO_006090 [Streptomyces antimycoticus]|uniref:Uncharacterized protein n=1 Tax=Streptomyces antimycoticus TaxID=68175 RepID=A0A499UL88_9ACTN|nr:hypothetical protein [Streptomyces antimycoticus]BBJ37891.1 hypothetical protein SSPO_006090 [Streptomyces antimycoticus]
MNAVSLEILAVSQQQLNVFRTFIGGMVVSGALVWAVRLDMAVPAARAVRPAVPACSVVTASVRTRAGDRAALRRAPTGSSKTPLVTITSAQFLRGWKVVSA